MSTQTATPRRSKTIVHRARQTHKTLKTAVPLVTTFVSMLGAVVVAMEAWTNNKETTSTRTRTKTTMSDGDNEFEEDEDEEWDDDDEEEYTPRRYSFLAHMMTLAHFVLRAAVLIVLAALVVFLILHGGQVVAAVTITALVVLALWLSELVSRRSH